MVDLDTFLTTLYVMADTFCNTLPSAAQPGPDASLTQSAVLTLALVGQWARFQSERDFPSPFVRFWLCLGVGVTICPPRRPDFNAFVERYHRSFEYECLRIYRPHDLQTATAVTTAYQRFYNEERPHQGGKLRQSAPARRLPYPAYLAARAHHGGC